MSFVHLNLHSEFSLVDGIVRIKPLFKKLSTENAQAVALTDWGNEFGAIKFYQEAIKNKIKPLFGADTRLQLDGDQHPRKITLLAQNMTGYLNLAELLSKGYREGQVRGVPHITEEWLNIYHEGLIAIVSLESHLGHYLLNGNQSDALSFLKESLAPFLDSRLYIGLSRTGHSDETHFIEAAVTLAKENNLPLIAHNRVRFLEEEDFEAHEIRTCIQSGHIMSDPNRPKLYTPQQYLRSQEEMKALFSDLPEAIENTLELAKRCTVRLSLGKPQLPNFPIPEGMTVDEYFSQKSRDGLKKRLASLTEINDETKYWERLETELSVICTMGFPSYFLIVADFIQWAKDNAIPVGPGRGSGAGSLVAWALEITDLDPLPYDLLFERFLNPERVSMPDFDIDFCMEGRDRVIDYVADTYGREAVSQIATHGTMAARAVVRDVGRALGHPYGFVDRIAKLIPFELGITLEKALKQEPELHDLYQENEEVKALIDYARKLEGLTKSVGRHAGGVVIAPTKLTDFSPLYCEEGSNALVTQYDKDDIEAAGLVKFDFLGLRTLTIIDWALKNIAISQQKEMDITAIPLDDPATFELLKACHTTAVFQLESRGMKDLLRRMQPDTFEDIIALVALFRPGPLESGMVEDFINRKHGREAVIYPFPELEAVLKPTYGVIVYQEQVMQISQIIGDYSLGGADLLRRAMGQKKPEEMAKQRLVFMTGAEKLGFESEKAGALFDLMEKFAGYGFNKSHSAAYALLSYETAYLKAHYPAEFMAAVLSSDLDHTDKTIIFIEECQKMGLVIRRPDINSSYYHFTVDQEEIVYGLGALKGYGRAASEQLYQERESNGDYLDLYDFCRRIDLTKTGRRAIEILIQAGAFDSLDTTIESTNDRASYRAKLLATLPEALKLAEQHHRNEASGQDDLFGLFSSNAEKEKMTPANHYTLKEAPPLSEKALLQFEKETLGFFLTAHPIDRYQKEIQQLVSHSISEIISLPEPTHKWRNNSRGNNGRINNNEGEAFTAGLITAIRTAYSKAGNKMTFITLSDRYNHLEIRLFDDLLADFPGELEDDRILFMSGTLVWDTFNNRMSIRPSQLISLEMIRYQKAERFILQNKTMINKEEVSELIAVLNQPPPDQRLISQNASGDEIWSPPPKAIPLLFKYNKKEGASCFIKLGKNFVFYPSESNLDYLATHFSDKFSFYLRY